jgi:hydroxymethylglutaryl-CoA synthase
MHRPYHRMPEQSFAMSYLFGLAQDGPRGRAELEQLCERAKMPVANVLEEMRSQPDILKLVKDGNIDADAYPLSIQLLKEFRSSPEFGALVAAKMSLGSEPMKDIGNVYCAALPAWIAAGIEDAYENGVDLAGRKVLAVGYGSGDAAEAIPMTVAPTWRDAASKIGFSAALEAHQDLTQAQYESLHDTGTAQGLRDPDQGFVIQSIGSSANPNFSDEGIEYYRYVR